MSPIDHQPLEREDDDLEHDDGRTANRFSDDEAWRAGPCICPERCIVPHEHTADECFTADAAEEYEAQLAEAAYLELVGAP